MIFLRFFSFPPSPHAARSHAHHHHHLLHHRDEYPIIQGYDVGKRLVFALTPNRTTTSLTSPELAFAGFFSAIPQTLLAGPAERVKVLLQVQGQEAGGKVYTGPVDVVRQLYKEGGMRSIFRGTAATLARDGPGSAACVSGLVLDIKLLG